MLNLSNLKPFQRARKKKKRLGRGNSSGHGTYSTRGQKGQRARSGGRKGLIKLGLRNLILQTPKKGGFKSLALKNEALNLEKLNVFSPGTVITPQLLLEKGLIKKVTQPIKILGKGEIDKPLHFDSGFAFSKGAKEKILKAQGTIKENKI